MKKIISIIGILLLCCCFVACNEIGDITNESNSKNDFQTSIPNETENDGSMSGKIMLPNSSNTYSNKSFKDALNDFESAGFTNIKLEVIYDLITGWFTSDGEIEKIFINGSASFEKGEAFDKDIEIIIVYHTWEKDEPQITMPNDSSHYTKGWKVDELINHFEQLGFTNIETQTTSESGMFAEFHQEGEIHSVDMDETFLGMWDSGDVFGATSLITITYYERTSTLTIDNCPDLNTVLSSRDIPYTVFSEQYDNQFIEFDACITSVVNDITGKVVSISVCAGDVPSTAIDNSDIDGFIIRLDTELTAGDKTNIHTTLGKGTKVKVIARVDDYYTDYYKTICAKAAYLVER